MSTTLIIYRHNETKVPLIDWLDNRSAKERKKCTARLEELAEQGKDMRRPHADYLDDGIYELRATSYDAQNKKTQNRILYCFVGQDVVLLTHGIAKTKAVPPKEIERAKDYRKNYLLDPNLHTYQL